MYTYSLNPNSFVYSSLWKPIPKLSIMLMEYYCSCPPKVLAQLNWAPFVIEINRILCLDVLASWTLYVHMRSVKEKEKRLHIYLGCHTSSVPASTRGGPKTKRLITRIQILG